MRAVIYSRYSSTKQDKSFSIEEQNEACLKKAVSEDVEVVKIFEDKAKSAKTIDRPGLISLLQFVENDKNNISAIYVYDTSRFSRNQLDFLLVKQRLSKHGITLRSVLGVNGDTLEGSLIEDIMSRVNQFKNEVDAVKIKGGMHARVKAGYALRPVKGYKWSKNDSGRSIIVPDDTFMLYRDLWIKIATEKLTLPNALTYINRRLPINKKLTKSSLSRLLLNKIYMGVLAYPNYEEEYIGVHKKMIEADIYWEVRGIVEGRKTTITTRKKTNPLYPLTKVLVCSKCGKRMTAASSKGKRQRYAYYFCRNRKDCKQNISVSFVHQEFLKLLKSIELTPEMSQYLKEFVKEKYEATFNDLSSSRKIVEKDINSLLKKQETLLSLRMENEITKEEYMSHKEKVETELLTKRLLLSDKQIDGLDIEIVLNFVVHYLLNVSKMWEHADIDTKVAIQSSTFPKGVYFTKNSCRTPEVGFAFAFAKQFETIGDPCGSRTHPTGMKTLFPNR